MSCSPREGAGGRALRLIRVIARACIGIRSGWTGGQGGAVAGARGCSSKRRCGRKSTFLDYRRSAHSHGYTEQTDRWARRWSYCSMLLRWKVSSKRLVSLAIGVAECTRSYLWRTAVQLLKSNMIIPHPRCNMQQAVLETYI
jgi:hypothetical protein